MLEHINHCFIEFINNPFQLGLAIVSLVIAAGSVFLMRIKRLEIKTKMYLIYVHLSALLFPVIFFALSMKCGRSCSMSLFELAAYAIPSAFAASLLFGLVGVPGIYLRMTSAKRMRTNSTLSKFVKKHASRLNISAPNIFFSDSQTPYAFSSAWPRPMIVLSIGLFDILNRKETEAVLLHELYHTRSKTSLMKISAFFMKFSPFSIFKKFNDELNFEEASADEFAAETQKTWIYVSSAKKKINDFKKQFV